MKSSLEYQNKWICNSLFQRNKLLISHILFYAWFTRLFYCFCWCFIWLCCRHFVTLVVASFGVLKLKTSCFTLYLVFCNCKQVVLHFDFMLLLCYYGWDNYMWLSITVVQSLLYWGFCCNVFICIPKKSKEKAKSPNS